METLTLEKFSEKLKQEGYCGIICNYNEIILYAPSFRRTMCLNKNSIRKYHFKFLKNIKSINIELDKSNFKEIYTDFNNLQKHLKRNFKKHLKLFIKRYSISDKIDLYKKFKTL